MRAVLRANGGISLKDVNCPLYLLADQADDITSSEQVLAARRLVSTPEPLIEQRLVPGGHIGLFMGKATLRDVWPGIGEWLRRRL
jgi:poly(3-hydroxybutyrate) depolymerase